MRVLIACEESQVICKAFRNKGHEAFSNDIVKCSGGFPEWHIQCDALDIINDDWDLIIAHPPCTYLAKSGANRLFIKSGVFDNDRFNKGIKAADFFMKFYNCKCKKVCIENPVPLKIFNLPDYNQIIQPYYFNEPYSKMTCLWLKNLPPLFATCFVDKYTSWVFFNRDPVIRSKSFPGIASAMADQWG